MDGVCNEYKWHYSDRDWTFYESYLLRFSNKPKRILDIGSGLGLFLECCAQHDIEGIGLELSDAGLEVCRQNGLQAIRQDLSKPFETLESNSFDAVFSFQVIEHLDYDTQMNTLHESYRVLKHGGQMQVDSPCRFYKASQDAKTHIGLLSPKQLQGMAIAAGFTNINMGYNYCQTFDDLPDDIVEKLWEDYHPDIFARTATILAEK